MWVLFPDLALNLMLSWVRRSGGTVLSPNGTTSYSTFIVSDNFIKLPLVYLQYIQRRRYEHSSYAPRKTLLSPRMKTMLRAKPIKGRRKSQRKKRKPEYLSTSLIERKTSKKIVKFSHRFSKI
jgi:hypothetical protein